jgi:hypothetical protein
MPDDTRAMDVDYLRRTRFSVVATDRDDEAIETVGRADVVVTGIALRG